MDSTSMAIVEDIVEFTAVSTPTIDLQWRFRNIGPAKATVKWSTSTAGSPVHEYELKPGDHTELRGEWFALTVDPNQPYSYAVVEWEPRAT